MEESDEPKPNRKALEDRLQSHISFLNGYIRLRIGDRLSRQESTMDLAQSVCREILTDADQFEYRDEPSFRKWLCIQAGRKILDRDRFYKRAKRDLDRTVREADRVTEQEKRGLLESYAVFGTPSMNVGAAEQVERIEAALAELPEAQREAIVQAKLGGLSYAEIAERMGRTESAVRGLVARGLAELSLKMGR